MHKTMLAAAILCAAVVNGQTKFTINAKIAAGNPVTRAVLEYDNGKVFKSDTVSIKLGKFSFSDVVPRPPLLQITLIGPESSRLDRDTAENDDQGSKNIALFYPEGEMNVSFDSVGIATVTGGGKENKAHDAFLEMLKENQKLGDQALPFEQIITAFIKKYPDAYMSFDLIETFAGAIQPSIFEPMLTSLSARLRNTDKAKKWKIALDRAKKFDVGQPSIDFALKDVEGTPVSLSSFRGHYVLLDFWASWCGPCRAANPELLAVYNKFRDRKFEILAVSLDNRKDAWIKAIAEDKLPWKQVRDLEGAAGSVAKTYNISQIPQNLLIDPNGIIVGRNLGGKALEDKLSDLLLK
ncbi:TlpA disulfide reductase family protein [Chitinophaga sp. Ak27]|uniref:TlpA disulfide reductase family protein n=1 Tax=Chitinophaga sp. Ak27 TaxID=2726116 RepID=UPI00145CB2E7|nr:TlpA disulfide reductase family protein [Chitinophaga sp. Ak27]NLU95685.1 AhpC/TSA family protein [Chitinophaga sp. Ak27]